MTTVFKAEGQTKAKGAKIMKKTDVGY